MNKYIIPICNISKSEVYNKIIYACSISDCKDKLIECFQDYSDSDDYEQVLRDLDSQDILIGDINDIEEL